MKTIILNLMLLMSTITYANPVDKTIYTTEFDCAAIVIDKQIESIKSHDMYLTINAAPIVTPVFNTKYYLIVKDSLGETSKVEVKKRIFKRYEVKETCCDDLQPIEITKVEVVL